MSVSGTARQGPYEKLTKRGTSARCAAARRHRARYLHPRDGLRSADQLAGIEAQVDGGRAPVQAER
eukprot:3114442-Prymnesium_polylepis.1